MNRGYAVSGVLYTILVLFMALLLSFLYSMQNKKNILDKLKAEVVEAFYCNGIDNIEDLTGATVIATTVESNDDNFLITIPKEGHYDTSSKLSVPISEINSNLGNLVDYTLGEYKGMYYSNYKAVYEAKFVADKTTNYVVTVGYKTVSSLSTDISLYKNGTLIETYTGDEGDIGSFSLNVGDVLELKFSNTSGAGGSVYIVGLKYA